MKSEKVRRFMKLAGHREAGPMTPEMRKLGAALLLSETLEYVVHGLGVIPEFAGSLLTEPNELKYTLAESAPSEKEMVDGLADVAYTMFWNALSFGVPLEAAFALVCDNNLEKFVAFEEIPPHEMSGETRVLPRAMWDCGADVEWPTEVARVELVECDGVWYAVGKDCAGKVRKPSTYKAVDLEPLLSGKIAC